MARILVVYSSFDGQTARIAERMAAELGRSGHRVVLRPIQNAPGALEDCDAVIVGGAVRYGQHAKPLVKWVRAQRARLEALPNAFFSVCMSAGGPGARPQTAQGYLEQFARQTGWKPRNAKSFAGACRYTRYNPIIRLLMKFIMKTTGGETDTSRDYEYTDWADVDRFAALVVPAREVDDHQKAVSKL